MCTRTVRFETNLWLSLASFHAFFVIFEQVGDVAYWNLVPVGIVEKLEAIVSPVSINYDKEIIIILLQLLGFPLDSIEDGVHSLILEHFELFPKEILPVYLVCGVGESITVVIWFLGLLALTE